ADGRYTSRDDVARYLRTYRRLPPNFITKGEARRLGWTGGPLEPYAPGKSIGGDHFGNYENRLPRDSYRECDIDTRGRPRGTKRLIYSRDVRRIYYTADHYRTFEKVP
ncbi:MAG: ribonuclease, partial [Kiritimatiellae bacterium]|nr:ribonuclease [Kiritimatiellia bacterium]